MKFLSMTLATLFLGTALVGVAPAQNQHPKPAAAVFSMTANAGMYGNRIRSITLSRPYSEVCFKNEQMLFDVHPSGGSTVGGNCVPRDVSWIIELEERNGGIAESWANARRQCLDSGMRLAEPFEWQISCENAAQLQITGMTTDAEWASNQTFESSLSDDAGIASLAMGRGANASGCERGGLGFIARAIGSQPQNRHGVRCAL